MGILYRATCISMSWLFQCRYYSYIWFWYLCEIWSTSSCVYGDSCAGIWRGWYIVPMFRSCVLPLSGSEQYPRHYNHIYFVSPATTVGWHRGSRTLAALSIVFSEELWWLQWRKVDDFWQERCKFVEVFVDVCNSVSVASSNLDILMAAEVSDVTCYSFLI